MKAATIVSPSPPSVRVGAVSAGYGGYAAADDPALIALLSVPCLSLYETEGPQLLVVIGYDQGI